MATTVIAPIDFRQSMAHPPVPQPSLPCLRGRESEGDHEMRKSRASFNEMEPALPTLRCDPRERGCEEIGTHDRRREPCPGLAPGPFPPPNPPPLAGEGKAGGWDGPGSGRGQVLQRALLIILAPEGSEAGTRLAGICEGTEILAEASRRRASTPLCAGMFGVGAVATFAWR